MERRIEGSVEWAVEEKLRRGVCVVWCGWWDRGAVWLFGRGREKGGRGKFREEVWERRSKFGEELGEREGDGKFFLWEEWESLEKGRFGEGRVEKVGEAEER